MTADEICKIIECAGSHGVTELSIDKISIKFDNKSRIEIKEADLPPIDPPLVTPNQSEIQEKDEITVESEGNDKLLKAEELAIMAIEDPSNFERLLATEDSLIDEFEREVDELEE